jgi:uncharacterized RDD family membrane protein YckC
MTSSGAPERPLATPGIARRLACLAYEGVLLFGVLMAAGVLFGMIAQQRNALDHRHGLQVFVFLVLAVYFTWFWAHGGQTVAMKAWHIRLVDTRGQALTHGRAFVRFLLSWLWFAPASLVLWLGGHRSAGAFTVALLAGMGGYGALARFMPGRQFLHDVLCGTRLVTWRAAREPSGGAMHNAGP